MQLLRKLITIITRRKDSSSTPANAEETRKPNLNYEKVDGTPFTLVKDNEMYYLAMGNYKVTEPTKHKEDTLKKIEDEKWLLIMHIAIIVQEKTKELERLQQKTTN